MKHLTIALPDSSSVELLPCPIDDIGELRGLLVEINTAWLNNGCGVGDVLLVEGIWEKMKQAIALLPRKDNPATKGWDLSLIGNDYQQLQELFFFTGESDISEGTWSIDVFKTKPPKLGQLHCFGHGLMIAEGLGEASEAIDQGKLTAATNLMMRHITLLEQSLKQSLTH